MTGGFEKHLLDNAEMSVRQKVGYFGVDGAG